MKDLSLHILDIAQNSITAGARHLDLTLTEEAGQIAFTVTDDGCGMSRALLEQVSDPFTTTRTTRKMGLGIPLLRMAAAQSVIKAQLFPCSGFVRMGNTAPHRKSRHRISTVGMEIFQCLFHRQHDVIYFFCQHFIGYAGKGILLMNGAPG